MRMYSSFAFQGVIIGSVYLKLSTSTDTYFSRGGVLFLYVFPFFLLSIYLHSAARCSFQL